ncbi:MAG: translation initiation factor eIF-2B [Dehalococcoidales bacterium]|nr:MAG: translation initiation factor eIF-2B [Dehalococcoidales bacterium]
MMAVAPDVTRLIDEIRDDRTHGAGELARQAVSVFKAAAEYSQADDTPQFLNELSEVGQALILTRPSMAPIRNTVSRLLSVISERTTARDVGSLRQFTISRVDEIISESLRAIAQIILHAREVMTDGDRIMTHSYSSTVVALLKEVSSRCSSIEMIVTRSGTGRTGEKMVWELSDCGLPITFVDDTALGLYVPMVSKILLGADMVCTDGVVNGVGSYQLVVMAAWHKVPVYIVADTTKFETNLGREGVDIEDRDGAELVDPISLPQTVSIRNPHFDITPLELINGVVTERGIMAPADVIACLNVQSAI